MLAPRTRFTFRNDSAEVGVGTLIVFIAMVLVAAVAAAVIISTSGTLQERALATGKEATNEVTANMKVVGVYGSRNTTADNVFNVHLFLELGAGGSDIDMEALLVRYTDGTDVRVYSLGTSPTFTLDWIRGDGLSNVMESGDLVELSFNAVSKELAPRETFELMLLPEVGNPLAIGIKMPSSFGSGTTLDLR